MKKYSVMWMLVVATGLALSACGKKEPSVAQASKMEETGKKICEKVVDCAMEKLKGLPEAQRKMAEGMMAQSKEACLGQYGVQTKAGAAVEKIEYTQEELDLGMQCMNDILKTSCDDLMKKPEPAESCKKFQEIAMKKRHSK